MFVHQLDSRTCTVASFQAFFKFAKEKEKEKPGDEATCTDIVL